MTDSSPAEREPEELAEAEILDDMHGSQVISSMRLRLLESSAPGGWRRGLAQIRSSVESGDGLEEAFAKHERDLPDELRCLFRESLRVPDPTYFLAEVLRFRERSRAAWRSLLSLIAYPTALFLFALVVGIAFSYSMRSMVETDWIGSFGLAGFDHIDAMIEDQHHSIVGLGFTSLWVIVVLTTVYLVGPSWAWVSVVGGMIVVGKPLRWLNLRELVHRYYLFLEQGVDPADVAPTVARSFSDSSQSVVARAVAKRVESGVPLGRALGNSMLADGLCRPTLYLLDHQTQDLTSSLRSTSELLGRIAERRCQALSAILPLFLLILVGTVVWSALTTYYLALTPLLTMISSLA
ncbi:MAG: type II secretion system F family protein [Pirellulaceae bacterium]